MKPDDPARWRQVDALLDELLELPSAERQERLTRLGAESPELGQILTALLECDRTPHDILDRPLTERFGALLADAGDAEFEAELIGQAVGPYQVTGRLGEGATGLVLEARQFHPNRTVALKVLRAGAFAGPHQLRMFRREAESLARLNHPGIATIHDAGTTPQGLPWIAMEHVRGEPLDTWLAGRLPLATRAEFTARLEVCLAVSDAISHAHQRGVVHLDLKPSNIMIIPANEGTTGVKVLDFGIAQINRGGLLQSTIGQSGHSLLGTLPYMSPEQANGDWYGLDVRSDVYSLGVLLYQMLTDRLPLDVHDLSLTAAVRVIREQTPIRPAVHVHQLRGDLEIIILKAMDKDPEQRYQSVAAFADDLRRHQENLPILGRSPSTAYQLRKIVSRHRVVIGLATAILLALVTAVGGTSFGLVRAQRAEEAANAKAVTAEQAVAFLESVFRVANPGESRGNAVTARELLDNAVADIETQLNDQPEVRGRLLASMGTAYRQLGLYRDARPLLEQALVLERDTLGPDHPRVGRSHYVLAGLLRRLGEFDSAREHYAAALQIRERGGNADDIAVSLTGLANLDVDESRFAEASVLYRRAMAITATGDGAESTRFASHLSGLALAQWRLGELDSATVMLERVVAIQRRVLAADDLDLAWSLTVLGTLYANRKDVVRARALGEESLAVQERALGPDHTDVAETLDVLANLHRLEGNPESARVLHERAAGIWERAVGADHATYGMALDNLALDLASLEQWDEAKAMAERARDILERTLPAEHPSLAMNRENLEAIHLGRGVR